MLPSLSELAAGARAGLLPPRGNQDPFAVAWASATSFSKMVELLEAGSSIGLYGVDGMQSWSSAEGAATRVLFRFTSETDAHRRVDLSPPTPEALRQIIPTLATYEQWVAALERRRDRDDPIAVLVRDLRRDGHADPRWLARHPVLDEAWHACVDPMTMIALLRELGDEEAAQQATDACTTVTREYAHTLLVSPAQRRREAEAIRQVVGVPHL